MKNTEELELLLEKARTGDDDAYVQLFDQYSPVVLRLERTYHLRDFEHDDWLQEGRLALMKAVRTYTKGHGTTFGLFYKMIAENQICSLVRKQEAKKRRALKQSKSIDLTDLEYLSNRFIEIPEYDERLYIQERLTNDLIFFSRLEKIVLQEYFIDRLTLSEISKRHALGYRSVRSAYDRIRQKFRQHIS